MWFGTEGAGLCKYNGTSFTIYTEKEGLPVNSITSIAEDKKGNLWLGTLGAGLHGQRAMVQNLELPVMAVGTLGQSTTQSQAHALVNRQPLAFQISE